MGRAGMTGMAGKLGRAGDDWGGSEAGEDWGWMGGCGGGGHAYSSDPLCPRVRLVSPLNPHCVMLGRAEMTGMAWKGWG